MAILVTGATGVIGRALVATLEDDVVVLSRDRDRARAQFPRARVVRWDGTSAVDPEALEGVDTLFHLAGEPVAEGRWTTEKKQRIVDSRVNGTRALVASIAKMARRPSVLVSASAVGYYGSREDDVLTEQSGPGEGFLADTCQLWEGEAMRARAPGTRVCIVRLGVVLSRGGGALPNLLPLFRTGLAGRLGTGRQWMSWIHENDVLGLLRYVAKTSSCDGPVNAVAPEPVTNAVFTASLARALHRPAVLAAPSFALRLALGGKAEVLLASQRVVPEAAIRNGYRFAFPTLPEALASLI